MIGVIFEAHARPQAQARYLALAGELKPLLADVPGFVAIERFQSLSDPQKILSLSWWESEAAVAAWRAHPQHRAAQREGQWTVFADYRIRVVAVVRDYAAAQEGAQHD